MIATRTTLNRYGALFRMPLAENLAYAGQLAAASLTMVMFMWIFGMLWRTVYAFQGASRMAGLTLNDTLWYLLIAETVVLSKPRLAVDIADSIKSGAIAYDLMRPYRFSLYHLSRYAGYVALRAGLNALAGGAVVWLMAGPPPSWFGLAPALAALVLAWGLEFCFEFLIGLAAFLVEDTFAFRWIYQKVSFILGGLLLPLDFYPAWLARVARWLPFASIMYGPGRLFVSPDLDRALSTLGLQIGWLLVLGLLLRFLTRRAMARLAVNGG